MPFSLEYLAWAVLIAALSAVSLPIGSMFGLITRPRTSVMAVMSAFGGGALLAALALELVAPTVMALSHPQAQSVTHGESIAGFAALVVGAVCGGVLFVILDQLVNAKGGFLRKKATAIGWFSTNRRKRYAQLIEVLGRCEVLRTVPTEHVRLLVDLVRPEAFADGEVLFREGAQGDRLFIIRDGRVQLNQGGRFFKELEAGGFLGELALLTGAPRTAEALAKGQVNTLVVMKKDFDRLRELSPELDEALRVMAAQRVNELGQRHRAQIDETLTWVSDATEALRAGREAPTLAEVRQARNQHGGATLGIWLGMLLDGIPESFVIGSAFLAVLSAKFAAGGQVQFQAVVPYTLIAGLSLSNFPEALSSSVLMHDQGWRRGKILFMWVTILLMTMAGAGVGYACGELLPYTVVAGAEGMAAGAMLTMIASTMLPEAVHLGSPNAVGLSTLAGFLSAVAFKLLE